jgi:antitoxin ParD1/3/4
MPSSYVIGEHFEALIDKLVESGRYNSRSEVVREGLRILEDREEERRIALEKFEAFVQEGIDSGGYRPAEEVFDELEAELEARIAEVAKTAAE